MAFPSATALRVFDAAARLGSFKAAASALNVTPAAVSHQIRGLETHLGTGLFERSTRKVVLTSAGQRLLAATGPAFQQLEMAVEEIAGEGQKLSLTTTPAFAALWLIPRLRAFEAAHPGIVVHVDTSVRASDMRRDRSFDLAIRYGQPPEEDGLVFTETFGAYAAPAYLEASKERLFDTLIETEWQSENLPGITWQAWFEARGEELGGTAGIRRFQDEHHVINACLAGQGVALVSTVLAGDFVQRGWLVPVDPETTLKGLSYRLIIAPDRQETKKVRQFTKWLCAEMGTE
ncbi:LysR substrate-binding domain-containing protein [Roseibium sp.]|uniref:LysR substrate-binding domain-containing protein n=1 Tax=Roseibium sp. TaxID=1936156 RepID=UPI003B51C85E